MSGEKIQCPICEYHGFESHLYNVFGETDVKPHPTITMWLSCTKINHSFHFTPTGEIVAVNKSAYNRFVTCFHNGKWKTLDKYDKTIFDIVYFMNLEQKQKPLLKEQIYTSQITWLLCSTRLNIQKDVARLIARMIDSVPYAPVYTEERVNLFRLLINWCNWCNRKKVKNE